MKKVWITWILKWSLIWIFRSTTLAIVSGHFRSFERTASHNEHEWTRRSVVRSLGWPTYKNLQIYDIIINFAWPKRYKWIHRPEGNAVQINVYYFCALYFFRLPRTLDDIWIHTGTQHTHPASKIKINRLDGSLIQYPCSHGYALYLTNRTSVTNKRIANAFLFVSLFAFISCIRFPSAAVPVGSVVPFCVLFPYKHI